MNTKDAIRSSMNMGLFVLNTYISDLSDTELMHRPPGCNHLAWQLGHLIASEANMLAAICPDKAPTLPEGFAAQHSKETIGIDDASKFLTRQQYQELYQQVRSATLAGLESLPDADLDKPSPEWIRQHFPTIGDFFTLIGSHPMMHAGQFAVARRQLGKPVLI